MVIEAIKGLDPKPLKQVIESLSTAREYGATIFTCGVEGGASTASHLATDLRKNTHRPKEARLRALCLSDQDGQPFDHLLKRLMRQSDSLIAISACGDSPYMIEAVDLANRYDITTIGLTGKTACELGWKANYCIKVPSDDVAVVESVHLAIAHMLVEYLK